MKNTIKFTGIDEMGRHWVGVYSRPATGVMDAHKKAFSDLLSTGIYKNIIINNASWHVDDQDGISLTGGAKTRNGTIPAICVEDGSDQLHIFEAGKYQGSSDLTASEVESLKFLIRNM